MESSGRRPTDPEVPLGDAAIATEIATAAARGRGADRAPTLEQLLAAFGEPRPTDAARRRVAAALRVAGMGVRPDLMNAEPGQRLVLLPPGGGGGPSRGRAALGIVGLFVVLAAAAGGATLLDGGKDGGDRVADVLTETSTVVPGSSTTVTPTTTTETTAGASDVTPETTATTGTTTTGATTTTSDDAAAAAKAAKAKRERAARLKAQRAAAAKKKAAATGHTGVTVRVNATGKPTFLCVDNGNGTTLFSGTLSGKEVFRAKRIRMNIGLKSTFVTVNGIPVTLSESPTGLDITRRGGARTLALGQRPCG